MLDNLISFTPVPIVKSDTTVIDPPLKGIDILAAGTLKVRNIEGNDVTYTFPTGGAEGDGGAYPWRLWGRIDRVYDTGTSLTNDDMVGIR